MYSGDEFYGDDITSGLDPEEQADQRRAQRERLPFGVDRPEALAEPFCACGHVVSQCDGSRAGCRGRGR